MLGLCVGFAVYLLFPEYLLSLDALGLGGLIARVYFSPRDRTRMRVFGVLVDTLGVLLQVNFYIWVESLIVVGTSPYWRPPKNRYRGDYVVPRWLFPGLLGAFLPFWFRVEVVLETKNFCVSGVFPC